MIRARSVAGPLRRAHPASGATWNVQVVRGKMSSQCLWHACRALSAGLLLMLLGAAMAVIGYYADTLSVAQEIRGNATVSVKDEARGFHLNNLSYAGPIVMGFGGFIVVAACVMTFEARDSAAKVTPARPTAMPRPVARRGPPCASAVPPPGARLDALGVYRLPHVLPPLPLAPVKRTHHKIRSGQLAGAAVDARANARGGGRHARYGSAPDLRAAAAARTPLSATALRRPLRRYALSVDEPPHSTLSASAAESECGSQSSLALEVHCGAAAGSTLRVRDNTRRRRPLARQPRLRDDPPATPRDSCSHIHNLQDDTSRTNEDVDSIKESIEQLSQCDDGKISPRVEVTPPMSPRLLSPRTTSPHALDTCILIEEPSEIEDLPEVEEPPEIEEPEPPDQ